MLATLLGGGMLMFMVRSGYMCAKRENRDEPAFVTDKATYHFGPLCRFFSSEESIPQARQPAYLRHATMSGLIERDKVESRSHDEDADASSKRKGHDASSSTDSKVKGEDHDRDVHDSQQKKVDGESPSTDHPDHHSRKSNAKIKRTSTPTTTITRTTTVTYTATTTMTDTKTQTTSRTSTSQTSHTRTRSSRTSSVTSTITITTITASTLSTTATNTNTYTLTRTMTTMPVVLVAKSLFRSDRDTLAEAMKELSAERREGGSSMCICNKTAKRTDQHWSPRKWHVKKGFDMACAARNMPMQQDGETRQFSLMRNWCWVAVKNQCHVLTNLKAPQPWAKYRKAAFELGNAPSHRDDAFEGLKHPEMCDRPSHGITLPYSMEEEQLASQWFKDTVAVYVLNLPKYAERWEMVSRRLKELNIKAERVLGVDMQEPGMIETAKQQGWVPESFDFDSAQNRANSPLLHKGSIKGTFGCAAAHFKAQAKILKSNSTLALVLEDDSYLHDGFVVRLWRLVMQELPCDWDIVQLLGRCAYGECISPHLARVQPDANEPKWRCRAGVNWGMHAMLYRSERLPTFQARWKHTVFNEKQPHCLDIDVGLASISDTIGYYSVPASQTPGLLKEMDLGSARSDINDGRPPPPPPAAA
eukprot:TRINITY_DN696_c3_g1_i1.p1 TRINITY_DN696_c3_g1~~TRINITY_DN696_c3_g1_i1.p1  ORF type:complete len:722 (+),score=86.09 TRINITY_DN696_c3_g1_i1:234-2168(+)